MKKFTHFIIPDVCGRVETNTPEMPTQHTLKKKSSQMWANAPAKKLVRLATEFIYGINPLI